MNKDKLIAFTIILFPIFNLMRDIAILDVYDEIIASFSFICITYLYITHRLDKNLRIIYGVLAGLTLLGFVSNLCSKLILLLFPIFVDALGLWKTFGPLIFFSYLCSDTNVYKKVINNLYVPAKVALLTTCATAIIGQFVDIGVTSVMRYGIKQFDFFWHNGIGTGWLLFSSILVISSKTSYSRTFARYLIIAAIPAILTFSSLVWCWLFVEIALLTITRKNKPFQKKYLVLLGLGIAYLSYEDISSYFLTEAPRMVLIAKGFEVANMYFPFGSGFATYGTEMAKRYYSDLYVQFGWSDTWALGEEGLFLNDVFLGSIIGQFGWIGFIAYYFLFYKIFAYANTNLLAKNVRISLLSTIITIVVVSLGSASVKTMMGEFCFATLGVVLAPLYNQYRNNKKHETTT